MCFPIRQTSGIIMKRVLSATQVLTVTPLTYGWITAQMQKYGSLVRSLPNWPKSIKAMEQEFCKQVSHREACLLHYCHPPLFIWLLRNIFHPSVPETTMVYD